MLPALGTVDHVICDPPYDDRTHKNALLSKTRTGISFGSLRGLAELTGALLRVASRWVICFCAVEQIGPYSVAAGECWIRAGVWDKINPSPQLTGDRPGQAVEGLAIMHRAGRKRWNRGGGAGIWRCRPAHGDDRLEHDTPKPVALMLSLVDDFTDEDEVIVDPFGGSGTTGAAALRRGRRIILIDDKPKYAALCVERCRAESRGHSLAKERTGQETLWR